MTPYLDIQHLTKSFGAQVLFDDISFSIAEGQKVGLIAKNGTGKSTLLEVIEGREGYDNGSIIFHNDIRLSYLEQTPKFDPEESVLDACFNHKGNPERVLKAKQILTQLHINDMDQPMGQLSGGQQKRVALANALIDDPDFLILDEHLRRFRGRDPVVLELDPEGHLAEFRFRNRHLLSLSFFRFRGEAVECPSECGSLR